MDVLVERDEIAGVAAAWPRIVLVEIHRAAVEPLVVLLPVAAAVGALVLFGAESFLRPQGMAARLPAVVAYAIPCEIIPILVAIVFILRSGTMLAAEIAAPRAVGLEQAGAQEKPERDSFTARVMGLAAAATALAACMSAVAIVGGAIVVHLAATSPMPVRLDAIAAELAPWIVGFSLVKAALFGALVGATNCFVAARTGRSPACIPGAVARGALCSTLGLLLLEAALCAVAWL